jgi:hypothetical protein
MRRLIAVAGAIALLTSLLHVANADAASAFASTAFQQQWQRGEAVAANFWGPLATAHDGQQESYKDAPGGQRLVQYFDKGRMESTNGAVTNGLLATEMIRGQLQTADATFENRTPPAIPIAGDLDNPGPTYAALASKGKALLDAAPKQVGNATQAVVSATGDISVGTMGPTTATTFAIYDDATKHNVPKAFADYRATAGVQTIGLALSEPFITTVKVAGTQRQVMAQAFERRVLTYTATNPPGFQVEMGNVGRQYYLWRYGSAGAPPAAPSPSPGTGASPSPGTVVTAAPTLNWSGYEVHGKNVSAVHAAWTIPTITAPPTTGYAATWVGIGGSGTEDLIQAGTEQDIEDGETIYYAWVEALPDYALNVPTRRLPAHPGDLFSVTITNTSGNDWTAVLENRTTGQRVILTATYTSCECSAEWIEEVPEVEGVEDPPLANFGTVSFTEATVTVDGTVRNAADIGPRALALKHHGKVVAQPQALGSDGASFAVAYMR